MKPANGKIIVRCDLSQKDKMKIGDTVFSTALQYDTNYRYKSPTIATVVEGNKILKPGDVLLVHHNLLFLPSPHHLMADLFSVPFSRVLFAKVDSNGELDPICGNVLCSEIEVETKIELPPELRTLHKNRYVITHKGWTDYKVGDTIFTRPSSGYQIVYHWNMEQRIAVKVDSSMICGILKPDRAKKNSSVY